MTLTDKKFSDLTKEQQKAIKKAARKLMVGLFLTGANFGGLMFMSNLVLVMAHLTLFHSTLLLFGFSIAANIYLLRMMSQSNQQKAETFKATVKKVLESQQ